jgi:hypothetical protein
MPKNHVLRHSVLGHLHFYCQVYAATRRSPLLVFHVSVQVHFTVRICFLSFSSHAGRSGKPSSAQRGLHTFLGVMLHVPHNDSPWRRVVSPARRLSPCKFEASNFCPHSGLLFILLDVCLSNTGRLTTTSGCSSEAIKVLGTFPRFFVLLFH